jgi:hypothetical protein
LTLQFGDLQTEIGLFCEAKILRFIHFRLAQTAMFPRPAITMATAKLTLAFFVRQIRLGLPNAQLPEL